MTKSFTDTFLNDIEKDAIAMFVENDTMLQAVKKVILSPVYFQGTLEAGKPAASMINYAMDLAARKRAVNATNEQIGADLMTVWEGINLVEGGFKNLLNYKRALPSDEPINEAR